MKKLFIFTFLVTGLVVNAQDAQKDTTKVYDYNARNYEPRLGKHKQLTVDPETKHNNPYKFAEDKAVVADTTIKQPANKLKKKKVKK